MMYYEFLKAEMKKREPFARAYGLIKRIYDGAAASLATPFMGETHEHFRKRPRFAPNLLRAAIEDLSYLYATDPIRHTDDDEQWRSLLWGESLDPTGIDAVFAQVDPLVRLGGTVLVVLMPDGDTGRFRLRYFEADQFAVVPSERDPSKVQAAIAKWPDTALSLVVDPMGYYWCDKAGHEVGPAQPHAFGVCPALTLKNGVDVRSVYGLPLGGYDLAQNILSINKAFEQLLYTACLQRGQPVVTHGDKAKNVGLGPDVAVEVDEIGGFVIVPNNGDVSKMALGLQIVLDALALGLGLPKRSWSVRSALDQANTNAVLAVEMELTKDRRGRERVARVWEWSAHELVREMVKASTKVELPPLQSVRYVSPIAASSVGELMEKAAFELEKGLAPRADVAADLNPNMPRAETESRLEAAAEEKAHEAKIAIQESGHSELEPFDTSRTL